MATPRGPGSNVPRFREVQLEFTAHVRDPLENPAPSDVEARRMQIYVRLIYNNIERLLALRFATAKALLGSDRWHERIRGFVARHRSTTPHFRELPQEFLEYLGEDRSWEAGFPYLLELCHYQWVKLALDISTDEFPADVDPNGDLLAGKPVVSPLAWSLRYQYPVHRITERDPPSEPSAQPSYLIAYRGADERVHFLESNAVTARLLTLLDDPGTELTGAEALEVIASELTAVEPDTVRATGAETLNRLRQCAIICGTRTT